jgi:HD-GYP domain-containing protein (c-di-GMP phosphodiesterase class II)
LTTDRPYRGALSHSEALETLFEETEKGWLDGAVVLKFSRICSSYEYFPMRERSMLAAYYS